MSARVDPVVSALAAAGVAPDAVTVDQDTVTVAKPGGGGRITIALTRNGHWHVSSYAGAEAPLWSGTFVDQDAAVRLAVANLAGRAGRDVERAGRRR